MSCGWRTAVALVASAIAAAASAAAQTTRKTVAPQGRAASTVLDVPFVAQSEALCGGAAAAMVLRYWGAREVAAEDFAPLLDANKEGIRIDRLAAGVRARGWQAVTLNGTADVVQDQLARRRPVIALVAVGRGRFHYIVITAWRDGGVLAHDPARAPDRTYGLKQFEDVWAKARHWMLVVTPAADVGRVLSDPAALAREPGPEGPALRAVSDRILHGAASDAVSLASAAARHDPTDPEAWYLLGAAEFLNRDTHAALDAWNHIGEPRLDLIRVDGLTRSSYASVAGTLGLSRGDVITADHLARATRRVRDLPAIGSARVDVAPRGEGIAQIDVGVVERATVPRSRSELAVAGARAAIDREVAETLTNVNGSGDAWSASWRWWTNRPRLAFAVSAPGLLGTHAVWHVEGSWEVQSYAVPAGVRREERTRAALSASDWITPRWKWQGDSGIDRWTARGAFAFAGGSLIRRSADDRKNLRVDGNVWLGSTRFARAGLDVSWVSRTASEGWRYLASVDAATATDGAPPDLWPGAGLGHARAALLRAHPLLDAGIVTGPAFGRSLEHTTVSVERWPRGTRLWKIGVAGFLDAAAVQHRLGPSQLPSAGPGFSVGSGFSRTDPQPDPHSDTWFVDAGAGLRLRAPWLPGVVRIDYARGLRDRASAVSVGWQK